MHRARYFDTNVLRSPFGYIACAFWSRPCFAFELGTSRPGWGGFTVFHALSMCCCVILATPCVGTSHFNRNPAPFLHESTPQVFLYNGLHNTGGKHTNTDAIDSRMVCVHKYVQNLETKTRRSTEGSLAYGNASYRQSA